MANEYTPTVWKTGDVITAEKLNKIEEGIANAGQPSWETVFEGSVTTTSEYEETPWAELTEVADLSADTIKVTFNGVEYTCEKQSTPVGYYYGASVEGDWSEYPFRIDINPRLSSIMTETAGTYTLKIEAPESGESDFSTAEVTLVNTDTETDYIDGLLITLIIDEQLSPTISPSTGVATTPLYKGECTAVYMGSVNDISVTGNATYNDGVIAITGDCTITVSVDTPES